MEEWLGAATQFATLASVLFGIYVSWQNSRKIVTASVKLDDVANKVVTVEENVLLIEKATNSMKDALVDATDKASHAAGKEEGRVEGEQKAAVLAQGKLAHKE